MFSIFSLDRIMGFIAPHMCIACGKEGFVLCDSCVSYGGDPVPPRCVGCKRLMDTYKTCVSCRSWLGVYACFVAVSYAGIYEQLLLAYKFDVRRQAAVPIAAFMHERLPTLPVSTLLCHVPTAPARIRQRGFDHSHRLASEFAKRTKLQHRALLQRKTNVRQLGSTRSQRIAQMSKEFFVPDPALVKGKTILLLDDTITTGATISAAAKTLKEAGAKRIYCVAFAQKE